VRALEPDSTFFSISVPMFACTPREIAIPSALMQTLQMRVASSVRVAHTCAGGLRKLRLQAHSKQTKAASP
jgi:hypothetical protein